jgi:hypothetical protein
MLALFLPLLCEHFIFYTHIHAELPSVEKRHQPVTVYHLVILQKIQQIS